MRRLLNFTYTAFYADPSLLGYEAVQIFILTHSWDDFCNLAYGNNNSTVSLFEIKKIFNISNIYHINNNKLLKPYVRLYREVYNFHKKDIKDISDQEALHMPNTMRWIIEEYVKFNVDLDFATAKKSGDISNALFKKDISELNSKNKQNLHQLLSICNILTHKAAQPKNPAEIHNTAKFLIETIKANDKYHHFKMLGN